MKQWKKYLLPLMTFFLIAAVSEACPTCKESVAENGGNLVRGYFWSILFMMSMPFLIVAGLCTMFYLDVRRARRRKDAASHSQIEPIPTTAGSV